MAPASGSEPASPYTLTLTLVIGAGLIAQFLAAPALWGHRSDEGVFLGAYSARYALVLGLHITLVFAWLLASVTRRHLLARLDALSDRSCIAVIAGLCAAMLVIGFVPIEGQVREYVALNGILVVALLLTTRSPLSAQYGKPLLTATVGCAAVGTALLILNALSAYPYSPDEAHWADFALTSAQTGGVYARTWLQAPTPIHPGLGWSIAIYGQALDHIALDIRIGRIWTLAFNLLACVGVGLAASALYGRAAAWGAVLFAALSSVFLSVFDYRPDHQLPAAAAFALLCAIRARQARRAALAWHFGCGLLCTGAMQLHAAAVVFAVGFSLFYMAEAAFMAVQGRYSRAQVEGLIGFGAGALLGTAAYYIFNILPAGGLGTFLNILVAERGDGVRSFLFLTWPSLFEGALIVFAFAFLLWRRSPADRLLLAILACVLIGLVLFDTQGYRTPITAFYAIPIGALIAADARRWALSVCLAAGLLGNVFAHTDLSPWHAWLQSGTLEPYAYAELGRTLQASLTDADRAVSTHMLIWGWPRDHALISAAAEVTAQERWALSDPEQVWERIAPTVVIDVERTMEINPGLRAYMTTHDFRLCERVDTILPTQTLSASIYRPECGG